MADNQDVGILPRDRGSRRRILEMAGKWATTTSPPYCCSGHSRRKGKILGPRGVLVLCTMAAITCLLLAVVLLLVDYTSIRHNREDAISRWGSELSTGTVTKRRGFHFFEGGKQDEEEEGPEDYPRNRRLEDDTAGPIRSDVANEAIDADREVRSFREGNVRGGHYVPGKRQLGSLFDQNATRSRPDHESLSQKPMTKDFQLFIVGGAELAPRGRYPFVTLLQITEHPSGKKYTCDGSLIASHAVLSAGHCFPNHPKAIYEVVAYVGGHGLHGTDGARVVVTRYEIHPDYRVDHRFNFPRNDFALLKLARCGVTPPSLGDGASVPTVELDDGTVYDALSAPGGGSGDLTVLGWGAERFNGENSAVLKRATTYPRPDCGQWAKFGIHYDPTMMCAGSRRTHRGYDSQTTEDRGTKGKGQKQYPFVPAGPCNGDSGGPLFVTLAGKPSPTIDETTGLRLPPPSSGTTSDAQDPPTRDVLVAAVSFGHKCPSVTSREPMVYGRVSGVHKWIRDTLQSPSFQLPAPCAAWGRGQQLSTTLGGPGGFMIEAEGGPLDLLLDGNPSLKEVVTRGGHPDGPGGALQENPFLEGLHDSINVVDGEFGVDGEYTDNDSQTQELSEREGEHHRQSVAPDDVEDGIVIIKSIENAATASGGQTLSSNSSSSLFDRMDESQNYHGDKVLINVINDTEDSLRPGDNVDLVVNEGSGR